MFISHGRVLSITDKPLIHDRIEAWKYGPVIPVLYHELKMWEDRPVKNLSYCGTVPSKNDKIDTNHSELFSEVLTKLERETIDVTVRHYGDWEFGDLQKLCHEQGSPWDIHYDGKPNTEIPDATIIECYKKELVG